MRYYSIIINNIHNVPRTERKQPSAHGQAMREHCETSMTKLNQTKNNSFKHTVNILEMLIFMLVSFLETSFDNHGKCN